jgi:hypothetical protein
MEPLGRFRGPTRLAASVIWSPIRKASEFTRFLASAPSLGHLIVETNSSLATDPLRPAA